MFFWAQKRISLRYPLRGCLELSISVFFSLILPAIAAKQCIKLDVFLADFEEISILYKGIKKMVKSQNVWKKVLPEFCHVKGNYKT